MTGVTKNRENYVRIYAVLTERNKNVNKKRIGAVRFVGLPCGDPPDFDVVL